MGRELVTPGKARDTRNPCLESSASSPETSSSLPTTVIHFGPENVKPCFANVSAWRPEAHAVVSSKSERAPRSTEVILDPDQARVHNARFASCLAEAAQSSSSNVSPALTRWSSCCRLENRARL